jgi:hypothetical protein
MAKYSEPEQQDLYAPPQPPPIGRTLWNLPTASKDFYLRLRNVIQRSGAVRFFVVWCLIAFTICWALVEGVRERRWVWEITTPIRFTSDIRRGFYWAMQCSGPEGYLNQYDKMEIQGPDWNLWLDYAPLRLLVMDQWGKWVRGHYPQYERDSGQDWNPSFRFNQPILYFNVFMDCLGSICAFFLTRLWVIRSSIADKIGGVREPTRGLAPGLAAALLLWFNPAMLVSAYGWPTWDSWIVPMFLLAALLASLNWWFCAGLAVAVGAMFKGQQLAVAPIFVIWPLVLGKPGSALRWCAGLILGIAAITWPWIFSYLSAAELQRVHHLQFLSFGLYMPRLADVRRIVDVPAILWLAGVVGAAAAGPWIVYLANRRRLFASLMNRKYWPTWLHYEWLSICIAALVISILVSWPWCLARNRSDWYMGAIASLILVCASLGLRPRSRPFVWAATAGTASLLCMRLFHGSHAWWDCAFHYASVHWPFMIMGRTSNLPGILQVQYGWPQWIHATALTIPPIAGHWAMISTLGCWPAVPLNVTSKMLFNSIYTVLLIVSGIGIGLQARRKDRRILVALITPWILFFTFPVQIHERYLLFAAGCSAICIGQSVGMMLLGVVLTGITLAMTLNLMMLYGPSLNAFGQNLAQCFPSLCSPQSGQTLLRYIDGTHPDIGWAVLVIAAVFLYVSLIPGRGR